MQLAEVDPIQIAIIVIAMLGGFVQWLWGLFKQGQEEAARKRTSPPNIEEAKLREAAWKRQVESSGTPPPLRPSPKSTSPVNDPWATVRDVFEQIKKDVIETQSPKPPLSSPPLTRARSSKVRAEIQSAPKTPIVVETKPIVASTVPVLQTSPKNEELTFLRGILNSQASIRQAVLMREILGPPKALQSSGDSAF
jgi:hypothetical protein